MVMGNGIRESARGQSNDNEKEGGERKGREPELDSEESCYGTPPMAAGGGSERRIMPGGRDYRVSDGVTDGDSGSGSSHLLSQTSGSEEREGVGTSGRRASQEMSSSSSDSAEGAAASMDAAAAWWGRLMSGNHGETFLSA